MFVSLLNISSHTVWDSHTMSVMLWPFKVAQFMADVAISLDLMFVEFTVGNMLLTSENRLH